jgi:hypothetical protein
MKKSKTMMYDFGAVKDQSSVPDHLKGKVLPIMEAATDMLVEVRKANIKDAVRYDPHRCEVALAFKARYRIDYIDVGSGASVIVHFVDDHFVVHFTIKGQAAWSRDNYDKSGRGLDEGMLVVLHRPPRAHLKDSIRERKIKNLAERAAGKPARPTRKKVKTRKFVFGINHRVRSPVRSVSRKKYEQMMQE